MSKKQKRQKKRIKLKNKRLYKTSELLMLGFLAFLGLGHFVNTLAQHPDFKDLGLEWILNLITGIAVILVGLAFSIAFKARRSDEGS